MKCIGILIGLVGALGLSACGGSSDSADPSEPGGPPVEVEEPSLGFEEKDLNELGPYTVGVRQMTLRYDAPGEAEPRPLPLIIWYPGELQEDSKRSKLKLAKIYPLPRLNAYNNLPLADLGQLPVAVYSHGSGGEAALAYPFGEAFASRGWVVIALSHTDNTTLDGLKPNGRGLVELSPVRPMDVQAVLDAAEGGFGYEDFEERFDVANTFLFGHSFGGFTSLALAGADFSLETAQNAACGDPESASCLFLTDPEVVAASENGFRDERVRAIGLQAPAPLGIVDSSAVEVPTLMLSGNRDATTTDATSAEPVWAGLKNPSDLWVRFPNAGHLSFITVCAIINPSAINGFVPGATEDGCGPEFTPIDKVIELNTAYLLSFAEKHILGTDAWDALLDGNQHLESEGDAELELVTHAP